MAVVKFKSDWQNYNDHQCYSSKHCLEDQEELYLVEGLAN